MTKPRPFKQIKIFSGAAQVEAEAKAKEWIERQTGIKNVKMQSGPSKIGLHPAKTVGRWMTTVHYEVELGGISN